MSYLEAHESKPDASPGLPTDRALTVADTGAGLLVFAACEDRPGVELVAFADVQDWSVVRDAVQARGIDVGATYTLPHVDVEPWDEAPGGGHVPYGAIVEELEDTDLYEVRRQYRE